MFIGRERELESLKEFYDKDGIGMTVIYGRRCIGKSTIAEQFAKNEFKLYILNDFAHTSKEILLQKWTMNHPNL